MIDLTVIILTYQEEIHIQRCIESVQAIAKNVYVVDSFSKDSTVKIAEALGVSVWQHEFINQADQFNWALDNLPIDTKWVMRLDADEYLEEELKQEIRDVLPRISSSINGIYIKRKHIFMDQWIRYGGRYPLFLLRIWRIDKGRVEQRWMDEHVVLTSAGKTLILDHDIVDHNLKGIRHWVKKHNVYGTREMVELLDLRYPNLLNNQEMTIKSAHTSQAKRKRILKEKVYARLPIVFRSFIYFLFRYMIQLGFLDGCKGFIYHFFQGFWYRLLVDIKVMEVENKCHGNIQKMTEVITNEYDVSL